MARNQLNIIWHSLTASGSGVMVDAGNTDTTNYTADDWRSLAEICD